MFSHSAVVDSQKYTRTVPLSFAQLYYRQWKREIQADQAKMAAAAEIARSKLTKKKNPKYLDMIVEVLKHLKDRGGSSRQKITKEIVEKYNLDAEVAAIHVKRALLKGVETGILEQTRGKGALGSFKLAQKEKKKSPGKMVTTINKKRTQHRQPPPTKVKQKRLSKGIALTPSAKIAQRLKKRSVRLTRTITYKPEDEKKWMDTTVVVPTTGRSHAKVQSWLNDNPNPPAGRVRKQSPKSKTTQDKENRPEPEGEKLLEDDRGPSKIEVKVKVAKSKVAAAKSKQIKDSEPILKKSSALKKPASAYVSSKEKVNEARKSSNSSIEASPEVKQTKTSKLQKQEKLTGGHAKSSAKIQKPASRKRTKKHN